MAIRHRRKNRGENDDGDNDNSSRKTLWNMMSNQKYYWDGDSWGSTAQTQFCQIKNLGPSPRVSSRRAANERRPMWEVYRIVTLAGIKHQLNAACTK